MFPNPIYLAGSSAFEPVIQQLALKLSALTGTDKVTLIHKSSASCDGVNFIKSYTTTTPSYLTGTATYYVNDPVTPKPSCMLAANTKADVGVSDVFYGTCPDAGARPANIGDVSGPVQAMLFIVPNSASATTTSLTAEEAQLIWGCGAAGMVSPFDLDGGIMKRSSGSGTQNIIAAHIGVPATLFKGVANGTGGNLVASLLGFATPGKAIGFLAADAYDTQRNTLKSLAFRAFNQTKAYYADSTATATDKRNVRDGHYLPWGPEHFIVTLGSNGMPDNPNAAKWLGWFDGSAAIPGVDIVQVEAAAHVIPQCAMNVSRTTDGGFLSPSTPADPCNCFFESVATGVATPPGCTACTGTGTSTCTGGKSCHHNFCE